MELLQHVQLSQGLVRKVNVKSIRAHVEFSCRPPLHIEQVYSEPEVASLPITRYLKPAQLVPLLLIAISRFDTNEEAVLVDKACLGERSDVLARIHLNSTKNAFSAVPNFHDLHVIMRQSQQRYGAPVGAQLHAIRFQ